MANERYPKGLKAILDGDVDLLVDTIRLQLYSGAAAYDESHDFLDDVAGTKRGSPVTLTGKSTTDGKFMATVPALSPPTSTIVAAVLYVSTGVDSTSRLLAWIDERADGTPLSLAADGSSFTLNWNGPIFSIGGI